jgi:hypothetical protein
MTSEIQRIIDDLLRQQLSALTRGIEREIAEHPPVNGRVPDVVYQFGPATQLRWFKRFRSELNTSNNLYDYHITSEHHRGPCCGTCLAEYEEDHELGYGTVIDDGWCCCRDERIQSDE